MSRCTVGRLSRRLDINLPPSINNHYPSSACFQGDCAASLLYFPVKFALIPRAIPTLSPSGPGIASRLKTRRIIIDQSNHISVKSLSLIFGQCERDVYTDRDRKTNYGQSRKGKVLQPRSNLCFRILTMRIRTVIPSSKGRVFLEAVEDGKRELGHKTNCVSQITPSRPPSRLHLKRCTTYRQYSTD